jgi:DNA-binding winged helix-turn-helix (wHTH) protein
MGGIAAFRLGEWWVEPAANLLVRGDDEVRLEPKAMEVLTQLVAHSGDVVLKHELIDEVWHTEFIAENTLTRVIAELRRALGDDARSPSYIQTIPKRGYRLIAAAGSTPKTERRISRIDGPVAVIAGKTVQVRGRAGSVCSDHLLIIGDHEIPVIGRMAVVGRGEKADIRILASEVSRQHARLECAQDHAVIEDLRSKNGTRVNDRIIDRPQRLSTGDAIGIGSITLVYRRLAMEPTVTQDDS